MDTLEGTVTINAAHDTRFEDIDIAFVGEWQISHPLPGAYTTSKTDWTKEQFHRLWNSRDNTNIAHCSYDFLVYVRKQYE